GQPLGLSRGPPPVACVGARARSRARGSGRARAARSHARCKSAGWRRGEQGDSLLALAREFELQLDRLSRTRRCGRARRRRGAAAGALRAAAPGRGRWGPDGSGGR
ncbi:unnamed protein product, partial [Prorocentrum cordatum]